MIPVNLPSPMRRRRFLRFAATGVAGAAVGVPLTGCGANSPSDAGPEPDPDGRPSAAGGRRILLAYFSRAGENYWNGGRRNLRVGNTEVLAEAIAERLDCDVHRIEAADPYPEITTKRSSATCASRTPTPGRASPNRSTRSTATTRILLASPIWNVRAPMIMSTFAERYDFSDKTVLPVTTYAMSGLGTTAEDYARVCRGARIGTGLAVRGEEVRSDGARAVDAWLQRTGVLNRS